MSLPSAKPQKYVIARPRRGRGALSAKRGEVRLGCNLLVPSTGLHCTFRDRTGRLPRRFAPRNDTKFIEYGEGRVKTRPYKAYSNSTINTN